MLVRALFGSRGSLLVPVSPFSPFQSLPVSPLHSQLEQSPVFLPGQVVEGPSLEQLLLAQLLLPSLQFCAACPWNFCLTPQTHFQPTGDTLGFEAVLIHKENPGSKPREKAFRSMLLPWGAQTFCTNSGANTVIFIKENLMALPFLLSNYLNI